MRRGLPLIILFELALLASGCITTPTGTPIPRDKNPWTPEMSSNATPPPPPSGVDLPPEHGGNAPAELSDRSLDRHHSGGAVVGRVADG